MREFGALVKDVDGVEVVVAPPFTALRGGRRGRAQHDRRRSPRRTCYFEREGAFTGEVSAAMIRTPAPTHVIVGHSERRRLFGETDEWVNRKTRAAIARRAHAHRLHRRDARRNAKRRQTLDVLDRQIRAGLDGLDRRSDRGAGHRLRAGVGHRHRARTRRRPRPTRRTATSAAGCASGSAATAADQCRILYGGSVKPDNIRDLIGLPDVDGALVGGASLDVNGFLQIVSRSRPETV